MVPPGKDALEPIAQEWRTCESIGVQGLLGFVGETGVGHQPDGLGSAALFVDIVDEDHVVNWHVRREVWNFYDMSIIN